MSTIIERPRADGGDHRPRAANLHLHGDLDARSVQQLRNDLDAVLTDATVGTVLIELQDVRFVDSSGLGALIAAQAHADATGKRLLLRNPGGQLRRLMDVTGAHDVFTWDVTAD